MKETKSTCPYCGVGCGVVIESDGLQITGVRGDPEHPANLGRLCTKGSTLHLTAAPAYAQQARLLQPMRRLQRTSAPQVASRVSHPRGVSRGVRALDDDRPAPVTLPSDARGVRTP